MKKRITILFFINAIFAASFWMAVSTSNATAADASLVSVGPSTSIYNSLTQSCGRDFIPDSPLRLLRQNTGNLIAFATHRNNWFLIGNSIGTLKSNCHEALGADTPEREQLGNLWIQAIYSIDGSSVFALLSDDHTQKNVAAGCVKSSPGKCWLNDIVAAHSTNMGQNFELYPQGQDKIAAVASRYDPRNVGRVGFFTVSNIAQQQGLFYFMSFVQEEHPARSGNCLFRSRTPFVPGSWGYWSGSSFVSPGNSSDANEVGCSLLKSSSLLSEVRSLLYVPARKMWITVFLGRTQLHGDKGAVPGIYMSQSSDLTNWRPPTRVLGIALRPVDGGKDIVGYPSVIDLHSLSRNYDTIDGANPILTYTVIHPEHSPGVYNREIRYVQLKFEH